MDLSWTFLRNIHVLKVKKNPRGLFMSTKSIFHPWRLTYLINFILFVLFFYVYFSSALLRLKKCVFIIIILGIFGGFGSVLLLL